MGQNRIRLAWATTALTFLVGVACAGQTLGWQERYLGDTAVAFVDAYDTGRNDGEVSLNITCNGNPVMGRDFANMVYIFWTGPEALQGNTWADITWNNTQSTTQLWFSGAALDMRGSSPDNYEDFNAFMAELQGSKHLAVSLHTPDGTVEADFKTAGVSSALTNIRNYYFR